MVKADSCIKTPLRRGGDPRHRTGVRGERIAAKYMKRRGMRVLARNFKTRFGELDLIVADDTTVVFCEVKTRTATAANEPSAAGRPPRAYIAPWESVGLVKQRRLVRLATAFLTRQDACVVEANGRPIATCDVRFDVLSLTLDARGKLLSLEHLSDAFDAKDPLLATASGGSPMQQRTRFPTHRS